MVSLLDIPQLDTPRQIQTSPEREPDFIPLPESDPEPPIPTPEPPPDSDPDLDLPAPDLPSEVNPESI